MLCKKKSCSYNWTDQTEISVRKFSFQENAELSKYTLASLPDNIFIPLFTPSFSMNSKLRAVSETELFPLQRK